MRHVLARPENPTRASCLHQITRGRAPALRVSSLLLESVLRAGDIPLPTLTGTRPRTSCELLAEARRRPWLLTNYGPIRLIMQVQRFHLSFCTLANLKPEGSLDAALRRARLLCNAAPSLHQRRPKAFASASYDTATSQTHWLVSAPSVPLFVPATVSLRLQSTLRVSA